MPNSKPVSVAFTSPVTNNLRNWKCAEMPKRKDNRSIATLKTMAPSVAHVIGKEGCISGCRL